MKMLKSLAAVAAFLLMSWHANASEPNPHDIFDEAMTGEFGEIIRTQALLEHVCKDPLLAGLVGDRSQKALAPFMPPLKESDLEVWRQIAGTVYNYSLQYRAGYAAGVQRGLDVLPQTGEQTPTAQLCLLTLSDAKRWTPK